VKNKIIIILLTLLVGTLFMASGAMAQWPVWTSYYGGYTSTTLYNGDPVPYGSIVEIWNIHDATEIKVGEDTVWNEGQYGFVEVTNESGISTGDPITFYLNGRPTQVLGPDAATMGDMGDRKEVNLSAEGSVQALFSGPENQSGGPGSVLTFTITIDNTGDGIDFYQVTSAVSEHGWLTEFNTGAFTYVHSGYTGEITFKLLVPPSFASGSDEVAFSVSSMVDPSVNYSGTALALISPTDVGDDTGDQLPGGFELYQNYPNPFNPTTTIAFELPRASKVTVEVYDLLGGLIERAELGTLNAGRHSYEFAADNLASGIYLYRLKAGDYSAIKKMALLK
jgi:hypothetical protein